ncbi:MAG: hypothetical protein R2856_22105 [Caldilineaceae bacterium]
MIEETAVCLFVNGREMVTLMASPIEVEALALGSLSTPRASSTAWTMSPLELVAAGRLCRRLVAQR